MNPDFLVHREGDSVGVAVHPLDPGPAHGNYLTGEETITVDVAHDVPLGHKIALKGITSGAEVIEYGVTIGVALADIATGDYVHVHNLRSARWQTSVA